MLENTKIPILHKLNRIHRQEAFRIKHYGQFAALTKRELEIIQLITEGKNNPKIAETLFISRHTVEQHRKNINRKLGINSMPQLFQYALAFDLI